VAVEVAAQDLVVVSRSTMESTLRCGRWLFGAVVAGLLILIASPALAHTGFESSSPASGDVVEQPVSEISLTFSGEASPVGD